MLGSHEHQKSWHGFNDHVDSFHFGTQVNFSSSAWIVKRDTIIDVWCCTRASSWPSAKFSLIKADKLVFLLSNQLLPLRSPYPRLALVYVAWSKALHTAQGRDQGHCRCLYKRFPPPRMDLPALSSLRKSSFLLQSSNSSFKFFRPSQVRDLIISHPWLGL